MSSASFAEFLTQAASTKRSPAAVGGKVGEMEFHLTSILIMPLMPIDAQTRQELPLNSPKEAKQTFTPDEDIMEGDHLVVGDDEFVIRAVERWPYEDDDFLRLILDKPKV